ncbi:hypothetical protein D9758_017335 [Tetrapyrgos nigripes]|uniref:Uncharacterized protein n=1 Tax=Tetrapyrgos nigripes TaxID=182062 RepID=A0A8H5CBW8_9AGAR|nr:hypothetical protein D9758_017335 [Tetrapyrgos nigripes]
MKKLDWQKVKDRLMSTLNYHRQLGTPPTLKILVSAALTSGHLSTSLLAAPNILEAIANSVDCLPSKRLRRHPLRGDSFLSSPQLSPYVVYRPDCEGLSVGVGDWAGAIINCKKTRLNHPTEATNNRRTILKAQHPPLSSLYHTQTPFQR